MKAIKKPIEIEYYPCEYEYVLRILEWSTDERPIYIMPEKPLRLKITTLE
jgi:hypothetical protein